MSDSSVNRSTSRYSLENLDRPALTLTGKELLRLDVLTDEAQGRVFLLQNWCSVAADGLPDAERRAVSDVFEQAWQALSTVRSILKLDGGNDHA